MKFWNVFSESRWIQLLVGAIFASILLPEWLALALTYPHDIYVNAWDEETYLSWQGVLGAKDSPGYGVLYLSWWMHRLGISGALQNLLFDSILTPLTAYLLYQIIIRKVPSPKHAMGMAVVVLFGSVLFNYANPLIAWIWGVERNLTIVIPGWERYPSALRTPNPQFSYFLVFLAVWCRVRFRKDWVLLLPLPVLYYYVAVPYLICLLGLFVYRLLKSRLPFSGLPVLSVLAGYLVVAAGLWGQAHLSRLASPDSLLRLNGFVFQDSRQPSLPLAAVIGLVYIVWQSYCRPQDRRQHRDALLFLVAAMFATANIHLVTGFMLSHKNYIDYGVGLLAGIALAVISDDFRRGKAPSERRFRAGLTWVLTPILLFTLPMQFVWFFRAYPGFSHADPCTMRKAIADPLHVVIPDINLASKFAYAHPMTLSPPFAYQYQFPYIAHQCKYYPALVERAYQAAIRIMDDESPDLKAISEAYRSYNTEAQRYNSAPYEALPYCLEGIYAGREFYFVPNESRSYRQPTGCHGENG